MTIHKKKGCSVALRKRRHRQTRVSICAVNLTLKEYEVFRDLLQLSVKEATDVNYGYLVVIRDKFINATIQREGES